MPATATAPKTQAKGPGKAQGLRRSGSLQKPVREVILLLPCPFCTGPAAWVRFFDYLFNAGKVDQWAEQRGRIVCTLCGARSEMLNREDATNRWNTRP